MANNNSTFLLSQIKPNSLMLLSVCSQAGYYSTTVLKDDDRTYFTVKKQTSNHHLQKLLQKSAVYQGGSNLRLEISIPQSSEIQDSSFSFNITNSRLENVGCVYTICIEDSDDEDFNDLYINLAAWNK